MQIIKTKKIKPNPNNPRVIKNNKFKQLVNSIKEFPEMLELRPIVVDSNMVVLGGNMRLKACIEAGIDEIPVLIADKLTDEQKTEFIVKDNVSFGEWDWKNIDQDQNYQMENWGVDLPKYKDKSVNLNIKPKFYKEGEHYIISLYKTQKEKGQNLEDFKADPDNAFKLAFESSGFIKALCKSNKNIVIITTPKRSHFNKLGYHFASLICQELSKITGIKFIDDVIICKNKQKINPIFTVNKTIKEDYIIILDDIISTASTMKASIDLFPDKNILPIALIHNS